MNTGKAQQWAFFLVGMVEDHPFQENLNSQLCVSPARGEVLVLWIENKQGVATIMTEIDTTTFKRIAKLQDTNERHKAIENVINQHFKLIEKNCIEDDTGAVFEISEDSSKATRFPDCSNIQDLYAAYDIYDKDSHSVVRRRIRGIRVANAALLDLGGLLPLW